MIFKPGDTVMIHGKIKGVVVSKTVHTCPEHPGKPIFTVRWEPRKKNSRKGKGGMMNLCVEVLERRT